MVCLRHLVLALVALLALGGCAPAPGNPTFAPAAASSPAPTVATAPTDTRPPTLTLRPTDTAQPTSAPALTETARPTNTPPPTSTPLSTDTPAPPTATASALVIPPPPTATRRPPAPTVPRGVPTTVGGGRAAPNRGRCPEGYPVKGNINQRGDQIYHVPGGDFYTQTNPEACFATAADAAAAGFRPSQR